MMRLGRARPVVLAIEAPAVDVAPRVSRPVCPHCSVPVMADAIRCYWCTAPLRVVEDWNPTPAEWFAAVGPYLIDRAAFVPGQMQRLAMLAVQQGNDPAPLVHAAAARLLPVARRVLLGRGGDDA